MQREGMSTENVPRITLTPGQAEPSVPQYYGTPAVTVDPKTGKKRKKARPLSPALPPVEPSLYPDPGRTKRRFGPNRTLSPETEALKHLDFYGQDAVKPVVTDEQGVTTWTL